MFSLFDLFLIIATVFGAVLKINFSGNLFGRCFEQVKAILISQALDRSTFDLVRLATPF